MNVSQLYFSKLQLILTFILFHSNLFQLFWNKFKMAQLSISFWLVHSGIKTVRFTLNSITPERNDQLQCWHKNHDFKSFFKMPLMEQICRNNFVLAEKLMNNWIHNLLEHKMIAELLNFCRKSSIRFSNNQKVLSDFQTIREW